MRKWPLEGRGHPDAVSCSPRHLFRDQASQPRTRVYKGRVKWREGSVGTQAPSAVSNQPKAPSAPLLCPRAAWGGSLFEPRVPRRCYRVWRKVRLLSTRRTRHRAAPLVPRVSGGRSPVDKIRIDARVLTASHKQFPALPTSTTAAECEPAITSPSLRWKPVFLDSCQILLIMNLQRAGS